LKTGIVASDPKEWHVERLMSELKARGAEAYILPATRFRSGVGLKPGLSVRGYSIDDYDAIIVRKVPGGTAERVFYRMDTLHRLEDLGVYVLNSADAIEIAVDKYYTSARLEDTGIKTPRTVVTESFDEAMKAFSELGGDVVVKPLFGSLGLGISRVSHEDVAYRIFRALELTHGVYYIQEYIPHGNEDIRAFVIGGEVVASMKRMANDWKTNISAGGRAEPYDLEEELVILSVEASAAVGLEYSGVDILRSEDDGESYVIELNSTPGWQGLQSVTEKDITALVVDYLLSKMQ
jgi:RimK family alpha-L-glutamate ligase|tara:strand:+ start:1317 stop:2195 length:879 start_codon:yes stop_codon:yes gene_type:complete